MYAEWLRFSGFRVAEAATSQEALARVHVIRPHIITTAIGLPGEDGWSLIVRLKADDRTRHIPIILVTAYVEPTLLPRARRVGCDAVLTKPCLPSRLLAEIERLLTHGRPPSAGAPRAA
jgi:CheY-like chemotaxis protein